MYWLPGCLPRYHLSPSLSPFFSGVAALIFVPLFIDLRLRVLALRVYYKVKTKEIPTLLTIIENLIDFWDWPAIRFKF